MNNSTPFKGAVLIPVSILIFVAAPLSAFSHGFAGDRFFPATLTTDDPFAASELSLPTFTEIRQPGQPPIKDFVDHAEPAVGSEIHGTPTQVWRAVSVDTHVTTGNFTFELL